MKCHSKLKLNKNGQSVLIQFILTKTFKLRKLKFKKEKL